MKAVFLALAFLFAIDVDANATVPAYTLFIGDIKSPASVQWPYVTGTQTWISPYGIPIYVLRVFGLAGLQGGTASHDYSIQVWGDSCGTMVSKNYTDYSGNLNGQYLTMTQDINIDESSPPGTYWYIPAYGAIHWSATVNLYNGGPDLVETSVRIMYTVTPP